MKNIIQHALEATQNEFGQTVQLPNVIYFQIEKPSNRQHGDFSSNIALILASQLKMKPREVAEKWVSLLKDPEKLFSKVEIAGPGFINFTFSPKAYQNELKELLQNPNYFSSTQIGQNKKVLIEYVSANPTGPMHVGHGRGAVVGDVLTRLLQATGHEVTKEFYVNDYGVQIQTLGRSAQYYLQKLESSGTDLPPPPEDAYRGAYVEELVQKYRTELIPVRDNILKMGKILGKDLLQQIEKDLENLQIIFDHYFSETSLYDSDAIQKTVQQLRENGHIFEQDGATWFRSTTFGDDKDRVLIKQDGSYTYFTPDIAYHHNKLERKFDQYINVWGADHGGYVPRIRAAIEAMGGDPKKLTVVLIQMVNLKRGEERVQMSKRSGSYVTLREVVEEVGSDATRYFFLSRSPNAQLDFDLELAQKQSSENPVFYIQYAHARIANIFQKAKEQGIEPTNDSDLSTLNLPEEFELIQKCNDFKEVLVHATETLAPHAIAYYLLDLAKLVQTYYSRAKTDSRYKVITADTKTTSAKIALFLGVQKIFRKGLEILAIKAPEKMEKFDLLVGG